MKHFLFFFTFAMSVVYFAGCNHITDQKEPKSEINAKLDASSEIPTEKNGEPSSIKDEPIPEGSSIKNEPIPEGSSIKDEPIPETPKPKTCPTKCETGEFCFQGKYCLKKEKTCKYNSSCENSRKICVEGHCKTKCEMKPGVSWQPNHPSCMGGVGTCHFDGMRGRYCIPPVTKSRNIGQTCLNMKETLNDSINDCVVGATCVVMPQSLERFCQKNCVKQRSCATGETCKAERCAIYPCKKAYCIRTTKRSIRKQGETCLIDRNPHDPGFDDCANGRCVYNICKRVQKASRKVKESCDLTNPSQPGYDACQTGLVCFKNRCHTSCGTQASSCPSTHKCYKPEGRKNVCLEKCDFSKGRMAPNNCPNGFQCSRSKQWLGQGKYLREELCFGLPAEMAGKREQGERCTPQTSCNLAKGLTCYFGICTKACDPQVANSCPNGTICVENVEQSHKGGSCLPNPTQKQGEPCDKHKKVCQKGLRCGSKKTCEPACDMEAATPVTNPACPDGTFCLDSTYSSVYGLCISLPKQPKGSVSFGHDCSRNKICDGSKNLTCLDQGRIRTCVQACNPRKKDSGCSSWEKCLENASSHLGGVCEMRFCGRWGASQPTNCPTGASCVKFKWQDICVKKP